MPPLDNAKHERFAQGLSKGQTATEAYEQAGYRGDRTAASRLSTNVNVQRRVAELQDRGALRAEVTIESLLTEAAEIQAKAMELGQPSAAVAALTAKAKLAGLWIDKAENTNRNVDADRYSDAELAAIVERDRSANASAAPGNKAKPH
jgi:phage terminase small subunit